MCELLVFGWEYNITLVSPHLLYSDEHLNDGTSSLGQQKLIGRSAIFGSNIFRVGLISWHVHFVFQSMWNISNSKIPFFSGKLAKGPILNPLPSGES